MRPPARKTAGRRGSMAGLALQAIAFLLASFFPRHQDAPLAAVLASGILAPASTALASWAFFRLGKQLRVDAEVVEDHQLIMHGPYSVVRHPIYAAVIGLYISFGLFYAAWPAFYGGLAIVLIGTHIRVHTEERLLSSHFGPEFLTYRRRVPPYIPYLNIPL